ncbi:hypothetical protein J3R83DRAFT_5798 [Lanmaoa asiatica]|nr:hypothetical protein J3R83DRAFT_5798 [Lanmaoa asiatica]
MDNTVPNSDSQFISLDSWLYETEEQSVSMDLPSDDAMFVSELFVQHIVPSIAGNHVEDSGPHSDPGTFPSKVPPPVVPVQSLVDDDHIVRAFAAQHRAPFTQILSDAGLSNWTLLGDVMLAKFFSDAGTQISRPFYGWREDMYGEFITNMHYLLLRRRVTNFECREIGIEIKGKNTAIKLNDEFPRILIAYWGGVSSALTRFILPSGTHRRVETAQEWTRRAVMEGIYTYPFLHDTLNRPVVNYYSRPELLSVLHLSLTHPASDTFMGIFSANVSADDITFGLLRCCNAHTFSIITGLVLTGLELIGQKKGVTLTNSWIPGDMKEKKFREVQKALFEEIRVSLACDYDITLMPLERQVERRNNLLYSFKIE